MAKIQNSKQRKAMRAMEEQAKAEPLVEKRTWTKAQLKHYSDLQAAVARAREAAQSFIDYLAQEYELDTDADWKLGRAGFERVIGPPEPAQVAQASAEPQLHQNGVPVGDVAL